MGDATRIGCGAERRRGQDLLFILLIVGASLAFSRVFACATPFAALAAVATTRLQRSDMLLATMLAWAINQAVGFGLLHYPLDASTIGWGGAIGLAVAGSTFVAMNVLPSLRTRPWFPALALLASFAAYELVLFAATAVLPSSANAFSTVVIARLLAINLAACACLLAVGALAERVGASPKWVGSPG